MPATLDISCPNCGKELKVPAEFAGKRVKCKGCQEVFAVTAPGKAARPAAKPPAAKPAAKAPPADAPKPEMTPDEKKRSRFVDDDDEDDVPGKSPNPLGVIREDDVARCPHCAKELDPPDATICVHCGFNNRTRVKAETKKVVAAGASDWMTHLAPGIIALLLVVGLVVLDIVCAVNMREWMEGGALEMDEKDLTGRKKMLVRPGAFSTLIIAISLVIVVPAVRFAIRRLVFDNKPEEKVKK
ncbi:MAG: hypothetical protein JWO38_1425 [Gemmataceae bacterium]|nr:hypothetical protein [Gemmataceae bacterium]